MAKVFTWLSDNGRRAAADVSVIGVVLYLFWTLFAGKLPPIVQPPTPPIVTPTPPLTVPPPPSAGMIDPLKATVQIRSGSAGCTATILAERPSGKSYWMLTAAHCVRGGPGSGTLTLRHGSGKQYPWKVVRVDPTADLCLALIETEDELPGALLADTEPAPNVEVWHQGFGVDRPGNLETGRVNASADRNGMVEFALSVSSGDSGSGVFRKDNGRWVAAVCCTSGQRTWGGSVAAARRLMTVASIDDGPAGSDLAPYVTCGPDGKHAAASSCGAPFVPLEVIEHPSIDKNKR